MGVIKRILGWAGAMLDRVLVGGVLLKLLALVVILPVLYYLIGMAITHRINDDTAFQPPAVAALPDEGVGQGSHAVAMAAALIRREVQDTPWVANSPFFYPSAVLDNMPNFQQGVVYALSRFVLEMSDQIGRTRGSSQVDPDLDMAAGRLKFPGTIWHFDFSTSIWPQATSETQYLAAARALEAYNGRLADGQAVYEARADNLQGTLDRMAKDLGSSSALIDRQISEGGFFTFTDDDVFYATKGRLYGYYMILKALGADYGSVITERQLDGAWQQMLDSLKAAAELQPLVVLNGDPDGMKPSHLAGQGFYLLRARTQMNEVINILLK